MEKNLKSIVLLLTTQAMINLGEIDDPVLQKKNINLEGSNLFISLIEVLKEKTVGNLSKGEELFITEVIENLKKIYESKKQVESKK